jgi:O-antigen ligase
MPDYMIEQGIGTLKDAWRGLTAQKNEFGQLSSFGVIFWVHGYLAREVKLWRTLLFGGLSVTCVFLSRSSTSLLATVFVSLFLLMLLRSPRNLRRYMPFLVALFAGTVLTYAFAVLKIVPGLDLLLEPITRITGKDTTFSNRSVIWEIIKEHIQLSPYIGTGYGAYWIGPVPSSPSYSFLGRMYFYPTESHNGYLEIVNDLGILGMICLMGYLIIYVRQSLQLMRIDRAQGALFLGLFFQQAIMNLSESCWLVVNSGFLFTIMTLATFALARSLLEQRLKEHFGPGGAPARAGPSVRAGPPASTHG